VHEYPLTREQAALLSLLVWIAFGRPRLETSPAAPLTFHFFAAQLEQAFAFAIFAFNFGFAGVL